MNIYLVIVEGNYGAIDANNFTYPGYNIIKFSLSLYILQANLSIDGPVIFSVGMVCERAHFFQSTPILIIIFYKRKKSNETIEYLNKINNGNVNVIYYYSKNVVLFFIRSI